MTSPRRNGLEQSAKRAYVTLTRALKVVAGWTGLLNWLRRQSTTSRTAHWALSLFHVHDIDGLLQLDVPWWTYDAIQHVEAFLKSRPAARVFEFGSGASTLWLAKRSGQIISIEHDTNWFPIVEDRLKKLGLKEKVTYHLIEPVALEAGQTTAYGSSKPGHEHLDFKDYVTSLSKDSGLFDLIVVDGRAREACLLEAKNKLTPGGIILFDNSNRARYTKALTSSGLIAVKFKGRAPSLPYLDETTVLQAPGK